MLFGRCISWNALLHHELGHVGAVDVPLINRRDTDRRIVVRRVDIRISEAGKGDNESLGGVGAAISAFSSGLEA